MGLSCSKACLLELRSGYLYSRSKKGTPFRDWRPFLSTGQVAAGTLDFYPTWRQTEPISQLRGHKEQGLGR